MNMMGQRGSNFSQTQPLTLISDHNLKQTLDIPKILGKFIDPEQLRQERAQHAKDKYKQLLHKIEFNDCDLPQNARIYKYSPEQIVPYIHFLKLLAKKPTEHQTTINRLKVWIPDTIVLNDGEMPSYWLFSNPQGFVFRTDVFTSKNVVSKLANYTSPDELVAVIKKLHYRNLELAGNDVKLICCRDMASTVSTLFANKQELSVIQKFIKSNGPKAFICRTVWRKDCNPYSWIITNKMDFYKEDNKPEINRYITNPRQMGTCTIVNTTTGKYVEDTIPYIKNILTYLHIHLGIRFKEFVADFIKDESGIWWLSNVKGFQLDNCPLVLNLKPITHFGDDQGPNDEQFLLQKKLLPPKTKTTYIDLCSKVKLCKYCEQLYPEQELQHKMTLKMVIQTDKHLYWRGKDFDWISRSDVENLDVSNLYQEHKVCKQCYILYTETEKLIELECHFNRQLGVPVSEDTQYQMLTLQANQINNEPVKSSDEFSNEADEKQVFDISATKQLILQDNVPTIHNTTIKQLDRFRFMVLIHSLRDIPQTVDLTRQYYLEYTIFDQKQRIKLDFSSAAQYDKGFYINVNRMRLFYFFSQSRKGISEYIQSQRVMTMYLFQDQRKIGTLDLELQDFLSERVIRREFMKVFSGKELIPILSWGVNLTLGLVDSGLMNVTRIKLRDHYGLFLPNIDYYTSEPLPTEWMTILNQKKDLVDAPLQFQNKLSLMMSSVSQKQLMNTQSQPKITTMNETTQVKDSLNDSTRMVESQMQLMKEIQNYEFDEDEARKKKRKKKMRAIF